MPENKSSPEEKKTTPPLSATDQRKPDLSAKTANSKTTPTAEQKKVNTQAKATVTKSPPAGEQKKPDAPAKADGSKTAPATEQEKPDAQTKAVETKTAPTTEQKKPASPAEAANPKATPTTEQKKPETPAKPADSKASTTFEQKKSDGPIKATDSKTAPTAEQKKPASLANAAVPQTPSTTEQKKPDAPVKAADTKAASVKGPEKAADGPKGVVVTQVFADRLEKPTEADLKSLPIPNEGEGFAMRLHPAYFFQFLDHPFSINREVKDYKELYDSIKENGINEPIKARPREGGGLELLSGHRRHDVAKQLNYPVPVVIVQADDDTARIEVVDGNLHRMDIPTSELARAAKMKMDALARKAGRRFKMEQLSAPQKRSDQQVAEDMGMSRNQVQRLVRIDSLVPELKQQVDDKKLPFNTAVELSYMKPEEQSKVVDYMAKEQVVPSMAQATELKEASRHAATLEKYTPSLAQEHKVDEKKIESIIKPKKEPELKVTFSGSELKDYFPGKTLSVPEVKRTVFEALDMRRKALEKQAKKQEMKTPAR